MGRDYTRMTEALTRAYELKDRLTESERYHVVGIYYWAVTHERDRAISTYEEMVDRGIGGGKNNLAVFYRAARRWAEAEALLSELLDSGSVRPLAFTNLINAQATQGKFAAAEATLEAFGDSLPSHPLFPSYRAYLVSAGGDYAKARAVLRRR